MNVNYFSEAKFNFAWEIPSKFTLFEKEYSIVASADAYYSTDVVTDEQNSSYKWFLDNHADVVSNIEKALIKEAGNKENALERFEPKTLKIKSNGECGLVFNDKTDFENGLVIMLLPNYQVMSTDEFF